MTHRPSANADARCAQSNLHKLSNDASAVRPLNHAKNRVMDQLAAAIEFPWKSGNTDAAVRPSQVQSRRRNSTSRSAIRLCNRWIGCSSRRTTVPNE
jgi:hypothetical protein